MNKELDKNGRIKMPKVQAIKLKKGSVKSQGGGVHNPAPIIKNQNKQ
jgi:hypothetical protein